MADRADPPPGGMAGLADLPLGGFGRIGGGRFPVARPERQGALSGLLGDGRWIARGAGRAYGDAALPSAGGAALLTTRLDRILDFDPLTGRLTAEPGVRFADLARHFLPRGWLAPVIPGTGRVTLGGALAADVHGKNQGHAGSFGDHVLEFELIDGSGATRRVDRRSDPELFAATLGGMGLTGLVTALSLALERVPSAWIRVQEQRAHDLDGLLALAEQAAGAPFSVGWIDLLAKGRRFGRGTLEQGFWDDGPPAGPPPAVRRRRLPLDLPEGALHPALVRGFNAWWWRRVPAAGRARARPLLDFLHPLDGIADWNRLYGRRGFRQFQAVLPETSGLVRLIEAVQAQGAVSFLSVLKRFDRQGPGLFSFCRPGWTLAMDLPERAGTAELCRVLERLTLELGGRIYLAKDSCLSAAGFRTMYPDWERFMAVRARVDPKGRFRSALGQRLGLCP